MRYLFLILFTVSLNAQILPSQQATHYKKNCVSSDTWDSSIKPDCVTFSNCDSTSLVNNCSNIWSTVYGEIAVSSGIQEWEITINSLNESDVPFLNGFWMTLGIVNLRNNKDTYSTNKTPSQGGTSGTLGYIYSSDGRTETNVVFSSYGESYAAGDVIKISLNMNNRELTFYKNGTSQGVAHTVATGTYYLTSSFYKGSSASLTIN
ncbi:hypothetical protein N9534_02760 [Flavobacteriaceae bacterium]|nr:hypothetical protein [Flavobacteriaceae bacterium]